MVSIIILLVNKIIKLVIKKKYDLLIINSFLLFLSIITLMGGYITLETTREYGKIMGFISLPKVVNDTKNH